MLGPEAPRRSLGVAREMIITIIAITLIRIRVIITPVLLIKKLWLASMKSLV